MSTTIIVDNEFITIQYYPDKGIIHHTIHQPIIGPELRAAMGAGGEFLKEHNIIKWLSDDRKNGPLPSGNPEFSTNWNEQMIEAGWKYWAVVVPEEKEAAGTLAPVIDDLYKRGLQLMVFTSVDDAMNWLDSVK